MKSPTYFKNRVKTLQASIENGCLIESPVDLLYLTGLSLSMGKLLIGKKEACLFVDGRYIEKAKKQSPIKVSLLEDSTVAAFIKHASIKTLDFDSSATSYDRFLKLKTFAKQHHLKLSPAKNPLQSLRVIKNPEELNALRQSATLLWKGFLHLKKILKVGMTEQEAAMQFEWFMRQQGAEGMAFEPIVAFGANTSMPHHRAGETKLKADDPILIDIGVTYKKYRSDMTRMILPKNASPLLKKYFSITRDAQLAALALCAPGTRIGSLDAAARSVMKKHGVEAHFLHSLGHGIGLETHEFPRLKDHGEDKDVILKPGMVITVEPGLYLPGKFGVRYEDTIAITKTGYENFYPE